MKLDEALRELEALGSEQTRKTWRRHGAAEPMFGVKIGDLTKLEKRIGVDHALAKQLWASGIHDARLLACMVADAANVTTRDLKTWAADVKDSSTAAALASFASQTSRAAEARDAWLSDPRLLRAGWSMVGHGAKDDPLLDDATLLAYLGRIEAEIHQAENWTRRTMMYAMIAIGGRSARLRKAAEAAARRIGPVKFDPGPTACEFPEPIPYIAKMWARRS